MDGYKIKSIVNVNKKSLAEQGFGNFLDWNNNSENIYIGRNMAFYVPGAKQSIWHNPFPIKNPDKTYNDNTKRYALEESLQLYKEYLMNSQTLMNKLPELDGKNLGCWCKPNRCHGDVIKEILEQIKK